MAIDTQPNDEVRPLGRWGKADRHAGSTRGVLCQQGGFLPRVRETGWFGGFAMFSRTRAGRRGHAILEEKAPNAPRPGCHPYGITNFGQEPTL